jgi:hypothetical protein
LHLGHQHKHARSFAKYSLIYMNSSPRRQTRRSQALELGCSATQESRVPYLALLSPIPVAGPATPGGDRHRLPGRGAYAPLPSQTAPKTGVHLTRLQDDHLEARAAALGGRLGEDPGGCSLPITSSLRREVTQCGSAKNTYHVRHHTKGAYPLSDIASL